MPRATPRIHWAWLLLAFALLAGWQYGPFRDPLPTWPSGSSAGPSPQASAPPLPTPVDAARAASLPAEARATVALIQRGGPFPHRQDGGVFGNREGHLPPRPRGWYREYTVATPGIAHRGARRIVTGGNPPATWYYTSDHYDSFRRFEPGDIGGVSP